VYIVPGTVLFADNETLASLHIIVGETVGVTTGFGYTVKVTVFEPVQPKAVPVTVYVVVTSGETETGVPPKLPGCQTYDVPVTEDVVLKVDEAPTHILEGATVGVKSGLGFITTVVVTGGLVWLPMVMVME
jgi:hypothetical protein